MEIRSDAAQKPKIEIERIFSWGAAIKASQPTPAHTVKEQRRSKKEKKQLKRKRQRENEIKIKQEERIKFVSVIFSVIANYIYVTTSETDFQSVKSHSSENRTQLYQFIIPLIFMDVSVCFDIFLFGLLNFYYFVCWHLSFCDGVFLSVCTYNFFSSFLLICLFCSICSCSFIARLTDWLKKATTTKNWIRNIQQKKATTNCVHYTVVL